ncbi:MAG: TAXI family TRAP transporter solute-binding subunit [Bauldia sp.]|nr:TAXI family TRAP transporter solute-binding subunit [Bauldia sp.]
MARSSRAIVAAGLGGVLAMASAGLAMAAEISIISGRPGGVYYPVAGAICQLVNEHTAEHGVTCTVAFGIGSVANIEAMRDGEATMAMAQSDTQRDALTATGPFAEAEAFTELRSVAALFVEQVTIAARKDKGIVAFDDLKGRRVYLGPPGSGGRVLIDRLIAAEGWAPGDVTEVKEGDFTAPNLSEALCDGAFDAFVITVGHPSPLIKDAASMCDVVLVPVAGPVVETLIAGDSLYAATSVPAGLYPGVGRAVPGIGLVATLVTTSDVDPDVVYAVAEAFGEGYERLRASSPLFSSLSADQIGKDGLTAPLHEGAARYYSETGVR